jgi:hypothetical protein
MRGIVQGDNLFERMANPSFWGTVRSGAHNAPLNAFLSRAAAVVRQA